MGLRGKFWLRSLVAVALAAVIFPQRTWSQAGQNHENSISSAALVQQTGAKTANMSTNAELAAVLEGIEAPGDLEWDANGNIVFLALRHTNATDRALCLVSTLGSLKELTIQGPGRREIGRWTREGIACLRNLTNLVSLRILCVGPFPALKDGVFKQICNLQQLRSLSLVAAYPERAEYTALTNLQNLAELRVSYATNFGNAELSLLTNLVNLKRVEISYDAVSREGTNALSLMPHLTNRVVRVGLTR